MIEDQLIEIKKDLAELYRKLAMAVNTANISGNETLALDIAIEMSKVRNLSLKINQFYNLCEEARSAPI